MPRTAPLVALFVATAVATAAVEAPRDVSLPTSAIPQTATPPSAAAPDATDAGTKEAFEQRLSQARTDIRATQDRLAPQKEMRSLRVELEKLGDDVAHMALAPRRLEDLDWLIAVISRKTETALGRMRNLAESGIKDPALETAARDLSQNAQDLLGELRRLGIRVPRIQEQIGYANEDSRQFAADADDATRNAERIAEAAAILLSKVSRGPATTASSPSFRSSPPPERVQR